MSVIGNIQEQVADALSADPFFASIPVIAEEVGDILNVMEQALGPVTATGGKSGGFVLVMSPDANANFGELRGPFFDDIKIHVQVTVNIPAAKDPNSGIGVLGLDIAENVCRVLDTLYPAAGNAPLSAETPTIQLMDRGDDTTTHLCRFRTAGGVPVALTRAATPGISESVGQVTLSCATAGAAIFYTLNGKNPMPLAGTLYTGTFTPGAGLTLKARAFLAGYLNSDYAVATT